MKTLKYILINIELFILLLIFALGICSADAGITWVTVAMIFGPFVYGKITNVGKQIDFCEVYSRAWNIKYKNSK